MGDIYFMQGDAGQEDSQQPDWKKFEEDIEKDFLEYDSVAIVQMNPKYNDGQYEIRAEKMIKKKLGLPCVRGYNLFQELNVQKRGATALLNARLLPVMEDFFDSIERSLTELGLDLPIVIVKSDGSIMSREFAMSRPVETLLCGPAASIIGAMELSKYQDALIVDMGGTTSDVAMVKDGIPVTSESGISIGEWKTMVKGVSIDTFALGGDSAVKYKRGQLYLDNRRCVPLCMAASQYPKMRKALKTLVLMDRPFDYPAHEFFMLVNSPANLDKYTPSERKFIKALENGPLIYRDAAAAIGTSPHILNMKRLEDEGTVIRIGMTPTDVMHVYGDYAEFDSEVSELGAAYLATATKTAPQEVCREIYDLTKCRLYSNLVRIFMKYETGRDLNLQECENLEKLTAYTFRHAGRSLADFAIRPGFITASKLIGIGAPTKIFLKDVAELLGTEADFPQDGKVANAIGAAMGNISTECIVKIEPYKGIKSSYLTYVISGGHDTFSLPDYDDALVEAKKTARQGAIERAHQQGAVEEVEVEIEVKENTYQRNEYASAEIIETLVIAKAVSEKE